MDEELKKKTYLDAMRLRNSGLDDEVIYARLEKQGVPSDLINRVLQNMSMQTKIDVAKKVQEHNEVKSNAYLIKAGAGVLVAIVSFFLFPGNMIIPVGCILGGIAWAFIHKLKS
jgi:hypothetical protein